MSLLIMTPPLAGRSARRIARHQEVFSMILAIPLFGRRVSPHFSTAPHALVVQIEGARIRSKRRIGLSLMTATDRKASLIGLGIDVLVCGGIDRTTREWFEKRGIRVVDNLMGEAQEILKDCFILLSNKNPNEEGEGTWKK